MEILSAEFVISNTKVDKCPQGNLPEYAFIGRSNVGKSSLINMLTSKNTGISINRGIYDSPYDAFTNYMNILGDFISRVNSLYPVDMDNEELNSLLTTIKNQGEELVALNKEVERLQAKLAKAEAKIAAEAEKTPSKKAVVKKPAAKKAPAKKAAPKKEE